MVNYHANMLRQPDHMGGINLIYFLHISPQTPICVSDKVSRQSGYLMQSQLYVLL